MVRRIQIKSLIPGSHLFGLLLFGLLSSGLFSSSLVYSADMSSGILVDYSFDDQNIETGPDTFAVYKKSKGSVTLSTAFPFSGYHSVEVKDVDGDRDFPELQGYFPLQEKGHLFAHFAFLVSNPAEPLNIALAGPEWFRVKKDGIGFWLLTKNGYLHHYSDSMPKKLIELVPFTWYVVDLNYDIDQGQYDLTIRQENQQAPLVELKQQANTSASAGSRVDKFSFIGDLNDKSNVVYYLDDVIIGTDKNIIQQAFKAPGRHKLFFDYLQDYQKQTLSHPICLPVDNMTDIGLNNSNEYLMKPQGSMIALLDLLAGKNVSLKSFKDQHSETYSFLNAVKQWHQGCSKLAAGADKKAREHFLIAIDNFNAPIYQLSYAMALAEGDEYNEAISFLGAQYGYWADDPRYAIAQAMVALNHKDWQNAQWSLEPFAISLINKMDKATLIDLWAGKLNSDLIAGFRKKLPNMWLEAMGEFIMAEQYFYLLLWTDRHHEAMEYAQAMTRYLQKNALPDTLWQARIGDSYFISGNYNAALQQYQQILAQSIYKTSLYKKISDIAFILGDTQTERIYRELVYGSLRVDKEPAVEQR